MMKDDDFKLLRGFDYRQTDEQTFVNVESLSLLKINLDHPSSYKPKMAYSRDLGRRDYCGSVIGDHFDNNKQG